MQVKQQQVSSLSRQARPSRWARCTLVTRAEKTEGGGAQSATFSDERSQRNVYQLPRSEDARKYFRTVYDFPQWQKHRNQYRLIDRLLSIPQSHIIQNIVPSVAWCTGMAVLVTSYQLAHENHVLPDSFPSLSPSMACQAFVTNTGVALSLLLVFRTNAGYGRWDEARKMWGGLLNRSRDLMRQGCSIIPEEEAEQKAALGRWIIAFSRVLRIHFQPEVTVDQELGQVLTPAELEMMKKATHRPVLAIHAMSNIIQACSVSDIHQAQMSANLTFYQDVLGGCERLLRAPIPVSYTRHTARFLFTWLSLLPLALYGSCGVWTAPVVAGISTVLCGIEEIGVQIEEPFGILPLDVICNRIQADVQQTLAEDESMRQLLADSLTASKAERAKVLVSSNN